jgi:hypothetical protein
MLLASRELIVRESGIGTNEYIIPQPKTVPQLDATLDRYPIPDHDIIFDENMSADVAICSDSRFGEYNDKLPDSCTVANGVRTNVCKCMYEYALRGLIHSMAFAELRWCNRVQSAGSRSL